MGSALTIGLMPAHLVQQRFPALQDLPLFAPLPESPSTELIVAQEVALTRLPATDGAMVAKTDPAPVLSPSQVRCFFDCPARWWFKYGLQLPERKNSSLALGLAVHQALEVNFREKIETREDAGVCRCGGGCLRDGEHRSARGDPFPGGVLTGARNTWLGFGRLDA